MEKVQNTVKTAKEFGEPDQHGNKNYWIEFTDGSKGNFRTPDNDLFIPGQSAEYAIKEMRHSEKAGNYAILQRYKEPYEPGKKSEKKETSEEDIARFNRVDSVRAISMLRQKCSITIEEFINECDIVFDYLHYGVKDERPSSPQIEPTNSEPTDVLPF